MRILHVLDHSLPNFTGYSFRSDYIVRMQRRLGLAPSVVTSPKHIHQAAGPGADCEALAGIDHYRSKWPSFYFAPQPRSIPFLKQAACVAALARRIERIAVEQRVDIIHAHSPSLDGLAANRAARRLGIPWVYELRYYEEDAAVDRGKTTTDSLRYRLAQRLEGKVLERADRVVTISQALRADLTARGVAANKIFEVPNGVDTDFFRPRQPDAELIAKHELEGKTVVGFIGSFYVYEGLDRLVEAMLMLLAQRSDVKLLLVGEGEVMPRLREMIPDRWREHIVLTGKIPHDQVRRYYSVMDILVYPRISSRLTELTTPLKPLEAMAMERVVIGSDIGGMREMVRSNETGFLVEAGNPAAYAEVIAQLAGDAGLRRAVGQRARTAVVNERDWLRIAERYLDIYGQLATRERALTANLSGPKAGPEERRELKVMANGKGGISDR
jgi:PEP-CTERM/exosortase A-associated glycosyltransferase